MNIKVIHCATCKIVGVSMMVYCRKGNVAYYHCRSCANARGRKYYAQNKEKCRAIIYKSIEKHKNKQVARKLLCSAVNASKIIRPKACNLCNKKGKIQGHHTDYLKPLEVQWLCTSCHADADKLN